jgi:hypothetical protein
VTARKASARAAVSANAGRAGEHPGLPVKAQSRPLLPDHEAARRALAKCVRIDEVKPIRNLAIAAAAWAREAKDTRMIRHATEIRMVAERRAGELLREMEKNKGARRQGIGRRGKNAVAPSDHVPKLADLGVSKTQSSKWQKLAALPADKFEHHVERAGVNAYDRMTGRFLKEADIEEAQRRHRAVTEHGCTVDDLVALAASGKRFPRHLCRSALAVRDTGSAGEGGGD